MKTEVDHFLKIGKTHDICEDYIVSGFDPCPHIILSDGCSSSVNTDIGARILVHLAKQQLSTLMQYNYDYQNISIEIAKQAKNIIKKLGINQTCLDATLLIMYELDNVITVLAFGDGYIIIKNYDDKISYRKISYLNQMPFYINYHNDPLRLATYQNMKIKKEVVCNNIINPYEADQYFTSYFLKSSYKSVLIASDGIGSFNGNISEEEIYKELTSFKNTKGQFIKRRTKKFITQQEKNNIYHLDDISIGGFYFNEE